MAQNPFTCAKVPPDIGVFKVHFRAKDADCRQSKKDGEQKRTTNKLLVFGQKILQPGHAAARHVQVASDRRAILRSTNLFNAVKPGIVTSSFTLMVCPITHQSHSRIDAAFEEWPNGDMWAKRQALQL